jgi:small-conductance mechanosensitive channel
MSREPFQRMIPSQDGGIPIVKRAQARRLPAILLAVVHVLVLALLSLPSLAWQNSEESASPQEQRGYPVAVDGYEIFRVHQNLGAITAQQRAERISAALEQLATAEDFDPKAIQATEENGVTTVRYRDQLIVTINDAEARGTGLPRQALARQYVALIQEKLNAAREMHSAPYLWRAVTYAVVTLLIYVGAVWMIVAASGRLLKTIETSAKARIRSIKIQESEILKGDRLARILAAATRLVRVVLIAIMTYVVLAKVFSYFPWTRVHGQQLLAYMVDPLLAIGQAFLSYLPKGFYILVIVAVTYLVLRFIRVVSKELERGRIRFAGFYPEWVQPTYKIVRVLLLAFAAVIIYPYLPGEQSPAFKGISVFLGVLFSLGSTSAVANFVAGIILIYTRGFRIGDWVRIGENTGEVAQQSMLATHVRTIRNEEITIPNSVVLGSYVTNFSLQAKEKGLALHTSVTIGYDAPWRTIHKLLIDAALKTRLILHDPPPFVLQVELEDSYVKYEINAYTDQPLQMPYIYSELHANIQDSFYEAGVEIMSPVFHALRDGNRVAIPHQYLPKDYRAPGFRVTRAAPATDGDSGSRP